MESTITLPRIVAISIICVTTIAIIIAPINCSPNPSQISINIPASQTQLFEPPPPPPIKRYVTNNKRQTPALSLHANSNYGGHELFFDGTHLSLPTPHKFKSHRFTGIINWTLYPNANYSGQPTCLIADMDEPLTYNEDYDLSVGSIRRGCSCNYSIKVKPKSRHNVGGIQLFNQHNAEGRSLYTDGRETRLSFPMQMKSFQFVGRWKKWTVFSKHDLTGDSYCLEAQENTGDDNWALYTNIKQGFNVRSIREGCIGNEKKFEAFGRDSQSGAESGEGGRDGGGTGGAAAGGILAGATMTIFMSVVTTMTSIN